MSSSSNGPTQATGTLAMIGGGFANAFDTMSAYAHELSVSKGWWEKDRNDGEAIALMHSELSEGLESLRKDLPSDHLLGFSGVEEELADVVIRIMDLAWRRKWRVGEAVVAKMAFNETRPHKHGGKRF